MLSSEERGFRDTFGLAPDEFLFHPEGLDFLGLCSGRVREFTVGELYEAVSRASSHEFKKQVKPAGLQARPGSGVC